jgi:hypothetical protein
MKPFTYALVYNSSEMFVVMYYNDWAECPNGCVMQTSNNRELLEDEADWRNESL